MPNLNTLRRVIWGRSFWTPSQAPSGFALTVVSDTSLSAAWTLNSGDIEDAVQLEIATDSAFTTGVQTFDLVANDVAETITGLVRETTYYGRVRVRIDGNYSAWSNVDNKTTLFAWAGGEAPSALTLTSGGTTDVDAAWTLNSGALETAVQLQIDTVNTFDSVDLQTLALAADDV